MNCYSHINKDQLRALSQLIQSIESKSSAEIITVIANRSITVGHVPIILFLIFSFLTVLTSHLLTNVIELNHLNYISPGLVICSFFASKYMSKLCLFRRFFTPSYDRIRQVDIMAEREFYVQRLNMTNDKTGILIYLSLTERRVVVLADEAINKKLPKGSWQKLSTTIINGIKSESLYQGLYDGISAYSETLQKNFPAKTDNPNELPNHIIIHNL